MPRNRKKTRARLRGTPLTRKMIKDYMEDNSCCPRCRTLNYDTDHMEVIGNACVQNSICGECGLVWTDKYLYIGFTYQDDVEGP